MTEQQNKLVDVPIEIISNFVYENSMVYFKTPYKIYNIIPSKKKYDISFMKFNRLFVIGRVNPPDHVKDKHATYWLCLCDCGNFIVVRRNGLTMGTTHSCGCYKYDYNSIKKHDNEYDLTGEFGIGYTGNTHRPFYFDLEDFELINKYYWTENSDGYARARLSNGDIFMHRLVCGITDSNIHIDHKYHNNLDNRKENLRPTSCHNNTMNEKLAINNTSGVTGVSLENGKWRSYIWYNGKTIHLGSYDNKEDAVRARIEGENQYFKEFGFHNSMKGCTYE